MKQYRVFVTTIIFILIISIILGNLSSLPNYLQSPEYEKEDLSDLDINPRVNTRSLNQTMLKPTACTSTRTGARTKTIDYYTQVIELKEKTNTTGNTFQLLRNSTVIDAKLSLTGLPSFDYTQWDPCSVITDHAYDDKSKSPAIALDSLEAVHVVWMDTGRHDLYTTDWDIIHTKKEDSKWQTFNIVSTEKNKPSRWPDIFIDNSDNVHIVWVDKADIDDNGDDQDIFYRRIWNDRRGMSATATKVISKEVGYGNSSEPKIAINKSGDIFVVWEDFGEYLGNGKDSDIMCRVWFQKNETWSIIYTLSDNTNNDNSTEPAIAVEGDTVFVVWTDEGDINESGTDQDIVFRSWDGTNWTESLVISNNSFDGDSNNATIDVNDGEIYIAWEDTGDINNSGSDKDIILKQFYQSMWHDSIVISDHTQDGKSTKPDIDVDLDGNIHLVWVDDGEIIANNSDNDIIYRQYDRLLDNWSKYVVISDCQNDGDSTEPRLSVAKNGRLEIVWSDDGNIDSSGIDLDIIYRTSAYLYPSNLELRICSIGQDAADWNRTGKFDGQTFINQTLLINKLNTLIGQMTLPEEELQLIFYSDSKGKIKISDFEITITSTPLKPTNLRLINEEHDHVKSHSPILGWDFRDNDSIKQGGFEIEVGSSVDSNDMWCYKQVDYKYEFIEYDGNTLSDNLSYYFRVRVLDPDGAWSLWSSYCYFTMNALPNVIDLTPKNGFADVFIDIEWYGTDLNNDDLNYTLEAYFNNTWNILLEKKPDTHYRLNTAGLKSYELVDIRCKCFDGYEESKEWNNPEGKITIIHNNPPSIEITAPPEIGAVANDSYLIRWKSHDLDENDKLKIDIFYDIDTNLNEKTTIILNQPDTGSYLWNTTKISHGGQYYICIGISDNKSYSFKYSTGLLIIDHTVDTNPPRVLTTDPPTDSHNIPINQVIRVRFSKDMNTKTLTSDFFIVKDSLDRKVEGSIWYKSTEKELIFYPDNYLDFGQIYSVIVKAGISDLSGNSMEDDYTWSFSTIPRGVDNKPPNILSVTPENLQMEIGARPYLTAVFSEEIDIASLSPSPVFIYDQNGNCVDTETIFISDENKLRIDIYRELKLDTKYTVFVTSEIRDLAGHGLDGNKNGISEGSPVDDYQWSFKTEKSKNGLNNDIAEENIDSSNLYTWSIIGIIIIIIITGLIIKRQVARQKFAVHDIFVIYHDGRLLAHQTFESISNIEESAMGGMLTAIQNFVAESFRDSDTEKLDEIKYGKLKIILIHGNSIYLAAVCSGELHGLKFKKDMVNLLSFIELKFQKVLDNWDGSMKQVREIRELIRI